MLTVSRSTRNLSSKSSSRCLEMIRIDQSRAQQLALVLLLTLSALSATQAIVSKPSQQLPSSGASSAQQQQQARSEDQAASSGSLLSPSSSSGSISSSSSSSAISSSSPSASSVINSSFQPTSGQSSSQYGAFSPSSSSSSSSSSGGSTGSSGSNAFVGLNQQSAASPSGSVSAKQPMYYDGLQASASEQSYQATMNQVNSALASYANSQASPGQQQASQGSQSNMQYQPVHYLYYPGSKDSGSSSSGSSSSASSKVDPMSASASAYQPYATYADQLAAISAGSSVVGQSPSSDPTMAQASNQDSSYLPQPNQNNPSMLMGQDNLYQTQPQGSQQYGSADLSAYANQLNPVHVSSPPQQQPGQQSGHQQQQQQGGSSSSQHVGNVQFQSSQSQHQNNNQPDAFLGAYQPQVGPMQASASQQQQQQHQPNQNNNQQQQAQPNGLFNQMGDLYTSNFGTASLSSPVASYMPPNQNTNNQASMPTGGHGGLMNQDLFGNQVPQQQHHQQQQQQQAASNAFPSQVSGNQQSQMSLLNNPYLNSLFQSPQFASQYAAASANGQPMIPAMDQSGMMASGSQASSAIAPAASKKFGLSSFIMPMLALAGLSLLVPTIVQTTTVGRKKRSIGEEKGSLIERQQEILYESMNGLANQLVKETAIGEYLERIERYYSLYKNAAQDDDCMNKLICEFGDSVKHISGKNAVIAVMEKLVPNWMVGKLHLFKEAAMDAKEGREKCQKYMCHHDKHFKNNSNKKTSKPLN